MFTTKINRVAAVALSLLISISSTVKVAVANSETAAVIDTSEPLEDALPPDEFDIFDRPIGSDTVLKPGQPLSPQAQQLADALNMSSSILRYKKLHQKFLKDHSKNSELDVLIIQCRLSRSIQLASLQLQETFANIDGDLAQTNMLYSYASTKRDRSLLLTNVATFVGSGSFGIMDSSMKIGRLDPASDILGILGFSTAVILPLLALRAPKYANPRRSEPRINMLAPLFETNTKGAGFQPLVWNYINSIPARSKTQKTRRELLIDSWRAYRGFGTESGAKRIENVQEIINAPSKDNKLTIDALKTRGELLIDLRALVQSMYRDLAEIDNAITIM